MKLLNYILLIFALFATNLLVFAHEDHNEPVKKTAAHGDDHKVEAVSDKYEYVLKFTPGHAGETVGYRLYINEYATNLPVRAKSLKLTWGKQTLVAKAAQPGVYLFEHPAGLAMGTLNVQVDAPDGADLVALTGINAIEEEVHEDEPESALGHLTWLWLVLAALAGAFISYLILRSRRPRLAATGLIIASLVPATNGKWAIAHDDHGAPVKANSGLGNGRLLIAKESQFLFAMETELVRPGRFSPSVKVFGTIAPAPQGQAVVSSPFTGAIRTLPALVGGRVRRGQLLATVEQVVDAQTQSTLTTERNNLQVELTAARADYERLQTVADIASKRDLAEAKARYDKARANLAVLSNTLRTGTGGRGGRVFELRSPIDGVVQNFNYAIGASLEAGQTAFTITNLARVFAEAQVFDKDLPLFAQADSFSVTCTDPARRHVSAQVRLVSLGQTLNASNQSQRVLFEVINTDDDFKIGEFVDVRAFSKPTAGTISVPTSAISEVDGKPVIFVKTAPEMFNLVYIQPGQASGERTVITSGLMGGERTLSTNSYQAKMIYNNQ